eukprot:1309649-Prymnesium_polylepis.1
MYPARLFPAPRRHREPTGELAVMHISNAQRSGDIHVLSMHRSRIFFSFDIRDSTAGTHIEREVSLSDVVQP